MPTLIEFAMNTAPREHVYLHQTVEYLRKDGFFKDGKNLPLRLICSQTFGDTKDSVEPYRSQSGFVIEENRAVLSSEKNTPSDANVEVNVSLCSKHYLAISGLRSKNSTHLCILEDDVKVSRGWVARLYETVEDIEKIHGERWLLTLFADGTDEPIKKMREGKKWYVYEKRPYWGTQAIVYPRKVALQILSTIMERCVLKYQDPIDVLMGKWADENRVPFLASAPSLVQHMGDVSTGFHRKKLFTDGFVEEI